MKIKTKRVPLEYAMSVKMPKHRRPAKPWGLLGGLIRILSLPDMLGTGFTYTESRMDEAGDGPYLILMNHSSFIDLEIAYKIFFPKKFSTVCTHDAYVGKAWIMRLLGCIPTQKFVTDASLILDMMHAVKKNGTSVLMFPEAGYTLDGCGTALPRRLGMLLKKLDVPVIMVKTEGAFLRDPLYNGLRKRKTKVSAHVSCLLTREEIADKSADELDAVLDGAFTYDGFAEQYEKGVEIREKFRATGLERILYRCASCGCEGKMKGESTGLTCSACGKHYEMNTLGRLEADDGVTEFPHVPDWFRWQRECVRREIEGGTYKLDCAVDIGIMADYKALYTVGEGRLVHDKDGFVLYGPDGSELFRQSPTASYSLNSDYYWYEIGDVISIGNRDRLFYCFPKGGESVAKARLAAEEMYPRKRGEAIIGTASAE